MKYPEILIFSIALSTTVFLSSGCASYRTISAATHGSPKIYSGTRLNIHTILDHHYAVKKFDVKPPEYPILDLPASFALDTIMLPLSAQAALYETLY